MKALFERMCTWLTAASPKTSPVPAARQSSAPRPADTLSPACARVFLQFFLSVNDVAGNVKLKDDVPAGSPLSAMTEEPLGSIPLAGVLVSLRTTSEEGNRTICNAYTCKAPGSVS